MEIGENKLDSNCGASMTEFLLSRKRDLNRIEIRKTRTKNFFDRKRKELLESENASGGSFNLTVFNENPEQYIRNLNFSLKDAIDRSDTQQALKIVSEFDVILSNPNLNAGKLVIESGAYKEFTLLLSERFRYDSCLQLAVLDCFINLGFCNTEDLDELVDYEIFELFCQFFETYRGNLLFLQKLIWFLANATGSPSSLHIKKILINSEIIKELLQIFIINSNQSLLSFLLWFMSNLSEKTDHVPNVNKEIQSIVTVVSTILLYLVKFEIFPWVFF